MEDYEVRDLFRRATTPDLRIEFSFQSKTRHDLNFLPNRPKSANIPLRAKICNNSSEPALYAQITIYIETIFQCTGSTLFTLMGESAFGGRQFSRYVRRWSIPNDFPIFAESPSNLDGLPYEFVLDESALDWPDFLVGYDIRAPGFADRKMFRIFSQPRGTLWLRREAINFNFSP